MPQFVFNALVQWRTGEGKWGYYIDITYPQLTVEDVIPPEQMTFSKLLQYHKTQFSLS